MNQWIDLLGNTGGAELRSVPDPFPLNNHFSKFHSMKHLCATYCMQSGKLKSNPSAIMTGVILLLPTIDKEPK